MAKKSREKEKTFARLAPPPTADALASPATRLPAPWRHDPWRQALARHRERLVNTFAEGGSPSEILKLALSVLDELDAFRDFELSSRSPQSIPSARAEAPPPRLRKRPSAGSSRSRFRIEVVQGGQEALAEYFTPGRAPFRCPQHLYEAVANAMERSSVPSGVKDILRSACEIAGEAIPDYLMRVCIRFWQSIEPPLISRERARYAPAEPGSFLLEARKAWRILANDGTRAVGA